MLLSVCPFIILFPGLILIHSVCLPRHPPGILLDRLCLSGSLLLRLGNIVSVRILAKDVQPQTHTQAHVKVEVHGHVPEPEHVAVCG